MNKTNSKKATYLLIFVSLGFLLSYPFNDFFWGRLISSGFCAAMIGGVADWFGVTALFRKPMGIPFRTQIIPRNRERIFDSLVHMVENELLTKEALKNKINQYSMSKLFSSYVLEHGGVDDLSKVSTRIIQDIITKSDFTEISNRTGNFIKSYIDEARISELLIEAFDWSIKSGYSRQIGTFLFEEAENLVAHPGFRSIAESLMSDFLDKLKNISSENQFGPKSQLNLALTVIPLLLVTPGKGSKMIQDFLVEKINELKNPESETRHSFDTWILQQAQNFKQDEKLQHKFEALVKEFVSSLDISSMILKLINSYQMKLSHDSSELKSLEKSIGLFIREQVQAFSHNKEQQEFADNVIRKLLNQLVDEKHSELGILIREKLEQFSNENLVETIESKVGNDLQIIRINGSVVGGIAGVIIFLATYALTGW